MSIVRQILLGSSRPAAEAHFASRTRSHYLGGGSLLCQILGGLKLFVIGEDVGFTPHMIFEGYWEFWLTRHFAQVVRPGDTVIDVGANLGYYTLLAADLVGENGRVVAIEPNPDVFRRLTSSIAVNGFDGRTSARNVALAAAGESGKRAFYVPAGEPKNGRFIIPGEQADRLAETGTVSEVALGRIDPDEFQRVDFIKIDVEGAELMVLEHLRPVIEKFRPKVVCEVNFRRGYSWDDLVAALGTDRLRYLDFHSKLHPLTREKCETEQVGEDWLVWVDYGG
jgi:FkbM family methyltransferase